ncbi:unnamed protein product [Musa acuminata subsp. burmannicoides]
MGTFKTLLFMLLILHSSVARGAVYLKYKDPKQPLNVRINDLLNRMTLAEKIGQMSQIERATATAEVIEKYFIGSVLSGGGSVPSPQASAETWMNMITEMQKSALSTRLGIPIIYGIDAVHGHNNVYGATIFPHNIGLGATRDPSLVRQIGAATALEVRATGIPYVFAPCVAVCRDPRWGRCYESYSEDPKVVEQMTEIIDGLQGTIPANSRKGVPFLAGRKNVAACAKHYVGDGGTYKGINENNTVIDLHGLLSIHMPPYYHAIIRGVSTVMVSYSSWNGVKMHANRRLVTDFLKNTLRFRGFVISDWQGIDKITTPPHANYSYSVTAGISAGIDMVMIPNNYTEFINDLTDQVESKIIPMSRIDDAVRRILRVKFTMGLFENPFPDPSLVDQVGKQEHRELARDAVRRSLVLLKNGKSADAPVLPLPKKTGSILVTGSHADNLGYQCGGWTITWQGLGGNNLTIGTTIFEAIKATVDPTTQIVFSEDPDAGFIERNHFSYAVVVVGEQPYAETFGDNLNLTIPEPGPSLIQKVCGSIKCVVVVVSGRPLVIEPYVGDMDAVVAAWLPGSEGQGVAEVLFGDYGFSGKLPRTWFRSVEQLPMNVGDRHYDPLFPYGFGLTTKPARAQHREMALLGIHLLLCWAAVSGTEYAKYKDPNQPVKWRIRDLMQRMTLAEKIGQMTQIERKVATPQIMKDFFIGSVLSGGGSVPAPRASAEAWVDMINEFQRGSLSTRLGIPMIYGIDAVHGNNNVYNATMFPHNIGLGATRQVSRNQQLVKRIGAATALEVRATGIPYAFAPCIAVCRDPRWGRCFESYSEDHRIVQAMTDIILGLQGDLPENHAKGFPYVSGERKVVASAKHFVGDGGTQKGINENDTIIDPNGLFGIHMPAYLDAIAKGVSTVMISYSSWNGVKMHTNRDLITGVLKNKLGFKGLVISDWEGLDRITSPPGANYTYSVEAGINAGIDMVMVPKRYKEFIGNLTFLVKNKFISMSRIDDAVRRILRVKFALGLFDKPLADHSLADQLGKKEHRELAREAVRKSLVLLKNGNSDDGPLLPLPKKAPRILVAGSHAHNIGYQCGGWTIEWYGGSGRITAGTTILEAIRSTVDPATEVAFSENPDADLLRDHDFSYAVVVVGEHPYAETFGDSLNLTLAAPGPTTIQTVCGAVKCAVVLVTGRPVVIEPYLPVMDALVAAWLPGSEGQGVADVLFGDYEFTGRLPRTWFRSVDQLPMNAGDSHYDPLFPLGFGLTTEEPRISNM